MKLLSVLILDDEQDAVNLLQMKLKKLCPNIGVIDTYTKAEDAFESIQVRPPDLLFIDVKMPGMNGFEFLESIMPVNFPIIFVTAYEEYALKAFKYNALDYLTKPFEDNDLIQAVIKAKTQHNLIQSQLNYAKQQISGQPLQKIAITTHNGISFIELDDILYAEASNNYSVMILKNDKQFILSKTLKDLQDVLEKSHFLRVYRQYIINLHHVQHFNRTESVMTMTNNKELPIARAMKDRLLEMFRML